MRTQITIMLVLSALLCNFQSKAQSPNITIENNSACQVYFRLISGDPASPCMPGLASGIIALASGGMASFSDPTAVPIPGASPSDNIVGAHLYFEYPGTCTGLIQHFPIGDWCSGYPMMVNYNSLGFSTCIPCNVNATWTSGSLLEFL